MPLQAVARQPARAWPRRAADFVCVYVVVVVVMIVTLSHAFVVLWIVLFFVVLSVICVLSLLLVILCVFILSLLLLLGVISFMHRSVYTVIVFLLCSLSLSRKHMARRADDRAMPCCPAAGGSRHCSTSHGLAVVVAPPGRKPPLLDGAPTRGSFWKHVAARGTVLASTPSRRTMQIAPSRQRSCKTWSYR